MKAPEWMELHALDRRYIAVPLCLLQTNDLPTSAAIIYGVICNEDSDDDGEVRIQQKRIAEMTGYKLAQVKRALEALTQAGLIQPVRTGRASIYRLTCRILPPKPKPKAKRHPPAEPPDPCPDYVYNADMLGEV